MVTGYTSILEEKPDTTFAEFAWRCARAFGVCIDMRDEPLSVAAPDEVKPSTYARDALEKAYARSRELEAVTLEEAARFAEDEYQRRHKEAVASLTKQKRQREVFAAMLAKVEAWTPPTPDHVAMKKFMVEQLTPDATREPYDFTPARVTAEHWLNEERQRAARDIAYHADSWRREQESAVKATKWLRDLRASLRQSEGQGEKT